MQVDALPASAITPMTRRARAKLLDAASQMFARGGDYAKACELSVQALAAWRETSDRGGIAEALNKVATNLRYVGEPARSKAFVEESLGLFRELSDKRGIAHALINCAKGNVGARPTRSENERYVIYAPGCPLESPQPFEILKGRLNRRPGEKSLPQAGLGRPVGYRTNRLGSQCG